MSALKVEQAFLTHFVAGGFQLQIAYENLPFTPTPGTAYAELRMLDNDITGLGLRDTNETDGIFRIILRYPVNTSSVAAKKKADDIFAHYQIGSLVEYQGQAAVIRSHQRQPGLAVEGWYTLVLSITYRAYLERS